MEHPGIKKYIKYYKFVDEPTIYIGVGPEKIAIENPSPELEDFIKDLDGTHTLKELKKKYEKAEEWLKKLDEENVIEDYSLEVPINKDLAERYDRQINHFKLYEREGWSPWEAQEKLANSRVVVIGAGAGGTTLLRFLNSSGIGTLEVVDFDTFSLDNLTTHTTLNEEDVGKHKVDALQDQLLKQNSKLNFIPHKQKISSPDELVDLVSGADFFCSAFDRPRTTAARWTNEAALRTGVPTASIGVNDKGARCGPIILPGDSACYECIGITDMEWIQQSGGSALLGTAVAMLGSIMVGEIVKIITGYAPTVLGGTSLYINTETLEFNFTQHEIKEDCVCQTRWLNNN